MRGWLSLAQNILQPSPPSSSFLLLPLSLSLVVSRKRDPEIVPLPRSRCSLRKRRRRRREVDRYDPELIRIAQRRRRDQLGETRKKGVIDSRLTWPSAITAAANPSRNIGAYSGTQYHCIALPLHRLAAAVIALDHSKNHVRNQRQHQV